jgi:hypothetical protein
MAIPSITMIPSGYKSQKVYSALPTNGDGDLTFDRNNIGTRVNKNGLIEQVATDVPRLDYSDGSCPSLLLELTSTNLAIYSQDFSPHYWSVFDVSKSANSVLSPDGTLNGTRLTALSGTNRAFQQLVIVSADPINNRVFTGSIYIKSSSVTSCFLRVGSATSNNAITISNEWQRFEAQYTLGATFTAVRLGVVLNNEGDEVDVAFGQVEEKPYATSYIPTTSGTQSRSFDSASKDGLSSYISSTAGVLYAEFAALTNELNGSIYKVLTLNVGTTSGANGVLLGFNATYQIYSSVGGQFITSYTPTDATDFHKVAVKYEDNNTKLFVNGVQVGSTNTTTTIPSGLSRLGFDSGGGGSRFHVKVRDVRVYNTALTDLELQTLTTI